MSSYSVKFAFTLVLLVGSGYSLPRSRLLLKSSSDSSDCDSSHSHSRDGCTTTTEEPTSPPETTFLEFDSFCDCMCACNITIPDTTVSDSTDDTDCDCDGKISTLTFLNTGDSMEYVVSEKSDGSGDIMFDATVANGETFTVNPAQGEDTLGTKCYINGEELHTSCSIDIYVGMMFGDLEITYGESLKGGPICTGPSTGDSSSGHSHSDSSDDCSGHSHSADSGCTTTTQAPKTKIEVCGCDVYLNDTVTTTDEPDDTDCACDGKISTLTFVNNGDSMEYLVSEDSDGSGDTFYDGVVDTGDSFTISPASGEDSLGTKIYINGEELHTSCSIDIWIGMTFGDLEITYGESAKGGPICDEPTTDDSSGHSHSKSSSSGGSTSQTTMTPIVETTAMTCECDVDQPATSTTGGPTTSEAITTSTTTTAEPIISTTTTEEPTLAPTITEACDEDSNYMVLSGNWEMYSSALDKTVVLDGIYLQNGDMFEHHRSSNNYTLWFNEVGGDYYFLVGDYVDTEFTLIYLTPVVSWSDAFNPLVNSDDEAQWEAQHDEYLEFVTGNMTLYDCEGNDQGTAVYTPYSHAYMSQSTKTEYGVMTFCLAVFGSIVAMLWQ